VWKAFGCALYLVDNGMWCEVRVDVDDRLHCVQAT
jgi:hypothetical protein